MPKSLSNRNILATELQQLVIRFQDTPSSLLDKLEEFLDENGLLVGDVEKAMNKRFEQRPDFPGWDAL